MTNERREKEGGGGHCSHHSGTHHGDHGGKPGMVARAARPEESIKDAADTREDIPRRSA